MHMVSEPGALDGVVASCAGEQVVAVVAGDQVGQGVAGAGEVG